MSRAIRFPLTVRLAAEALGTLLLVTAVVGSGMRILKEARLIVGGIERPAFAIRSIQQPRAAHHLY
jgi:hypothetical protein